LIEELALRGGSLEAIRKRSCKQSFFHLVTSRSRRIARKHEQIAGHYLPRGTDLSMLTQA